MPYKSLGRSFSSPERAYYGTSPDAFRQYGLWFGYSAIVLAYALFFLLWPSQPLPPEVFVANVFFIALCCFPLVLWKSRGGHNIPMFELICLAYGVNFGLVGQLLPNSIVILSEPISFDWEGLLNATLLSILGLLR